MKNIFLTFFIYSATAPAIKKVKYGVKKVTVQKYSLSCISNDSLYRAFHKYLFIFSGRLISIKCNVDQDSILFLNHSWTFNS